MNIKRIFLVSVIAVAIIASVGAVSADGLEMMHFKLQKRVPYLLFQTMMLS